jgi:hypothetical protein
MLERNGSAFEVKPINGKLRLDSRHISLLMSPSGQKRTCRRQIMMSPDERERRRKRGIGGRGEIRTHETLSRLPVFKTGALNHSATLPRSGLALERAVAQSYQEKLQ